ncbi:MAG: hypothetical protein HQK51_01830 [Oligoflexia bacterium]|nr:hypothetical protein [Oligoflexia bacterium]
MGDILTNLFSNFSVWNKNLEDVEKFVDAGGDFSSIPLLNLHSLIKKSSIPYDMLPSLLPKLTFEQRQLLLDLDFWQKDTLDVKNFNFWVEVYSQVKEEEIQFEFVQGTTFSLFIKARFNIWTFDAEEPLYPEHDNYFITPDNQLLFEFDDDFYYVREIKMLIDVLYSNLGVEKAYAHLFKIISDSYSMMIEDEYRMKVGRLEEEGIVDYYRALEICSSLSSIPSLNNYLLKKKDNFIKSIFTKATKETPSDEEINNINVHANWPIHLYEELADIKEELSKIKSDKRKRYLQFDFVQLMNSTMVLNNSFNSSTLALTELGKETKNIVTLGFEYLIQQMKLSNSKPNSKPISKPNSKSKCDCGCDGEINNNNINVKIVEDYSFKEALKEEGIFKIYDFVDLYKCGYTLIKLNQQRIKNALKNSAFDSEKSEYFLGSYLNELVDNSFSLSSNINTAQIDNLLDYEKWNQKIEFFLSILPYIKSFHKTLSDLIKESKISDAYYLNYNLDNIDFEALIISSFARFVLDDVDANSNSSSKDKKPKMGLTISEFKKFIKDKEILIENKIADFNDSNKLKNKILQFRDTFGFREVAGFDKYLYEILDQHLSGILSSNDSGNDSGFDIAESDLIHVGGPIIFHPDLGADLEAVKQ